LGRRAILSVFAMVAMLVLAGCGAGGPVVASKSDVASLAQTIEALGPDVDPAEAARAAEIAYAHTRELAILYEIEDPPLVHNSKVNMGVKPRGLCWHWAEDMERRLDAENFQTLELHRAIANSESAILIDHSTAIVSAKGDSFRDGVVVDPWRYGGRLFWSPLLEDTRYEWRSREVVLAEKRADLIARGMPPGSY